LTVEVSGMREQTVVLYPSRLRDPDGAQVRGALVARFRCERARLWRELLVYAVAALSAPVWLSALAARWFSSQWRAFFLACWAYCAAALICAAVAERLFDRQSRRLADACSGDPRPPSGPVA
jgi:peptidoglycan/LPS O-acetylase OafA/YrhL